MQSSSLIFLYCLCTASLCLAMEPEQKKVPLEQFFKYLPKELRLELAPQVIFNAIDSAKDRDDAIKKVNEFYQHGLYPELFNNFKFTKALISAIARKFAQGDEGPYFISRELTLPTMKQWLDMYYQERKLRTVINDLNLDESKRLAQIQYLIKNGHVDPNGGFVGFATPLGAAAFDGNLPIVRYLVGQGADVNKADTQGVTALHFAAIQGHADIARYLLDTGAHINAQDMYGTTPLMEATFYGRAPLVELLLARGANTHLTDKEGRAALENLP